MFLRVPGVVNASVRSCGNGAGRATGSQTRAKAMKMPDPVLSA